MIIRGPIEKDDGQWFFWDETWCYSFGPYSNYEQAEQELKRYCHWLDTGEILRPGYMN